MYPGYASATLLESRTTIEAGTTGLRTWSASLVLGQYLLAHPGSFHPGHPCQTSIHFRAAQKS